MRSSLAVLTLLFGSAFLVVGCDSPAENRQEERSEAIEDTADNVSDTVEDVADNVDDTGRKIAD